MDPQVYRTKIGDKEVNTQTVLGAFVPNQVTSLVYGAVQVNKGDTGIEVGAGTGAGTLYLARKEELKHLFAIEPVEMHIELLNKELRAQNLERKVTVLMGSLFEPIRTFYEGIEDEIAVDFIVSDASGMDEAGRILGWYNNNIPLGGENGAEVTIKFLKEAGYLLNLNNQDRRVYFPIIEQFADGEAILETANARFKNVREIGRKEFPLTGEGISALTTAGYIPYKPFGTRGSRKLWSAVVYEAREPRIG